MNPQPNPTQPTAAPAAQPQVVQPAPAQPVAAPAVQSAVAPAAVPATAQQPMAMQPAAAPVAQPAQPVATQPVAPVAQPTAQPAAATTQAAAQPAPNQPQPEAKVQTESPTSTQSTLLISELRDGLVIMKDGSFRAVIACQSINFDLMSESEREGVEYSYQNFLNSLNFTTQILIRSQRVDIGPYLERLTEIRRTNDNMLLGVLMDDYINFIEILSQEANIMDKSFFIVIPYYSSEDAEKMVQETKNFFKTFTAAKPPEVTRINRETYDKAITEINNRVETVISGLFQIGIHSVRLNTKELAALYYNFNNPDTAVREPLVDFSKLATTYVKKGEQPNVQ